MPRTTKPAGGGKRHPLNMRTTRETRERLEAAAAASGRSLVQEVEFRLERSFDQDQRIEDIFGGIDAYRLMRVVAAVMDAAGSIAQNFTPGPGFVEAGSWPADPFAYDQAVKAGVHALEALRPPGEPKLLSGADTAVANMIGERTAQRMLKVLSDVRSELLSDLPQNGNKDKDK